jgi:hypothetical protein
MFFHLSLDLYTIGRTPWTSDWAVARPVPKYRTTQTQNKRTQTSMPRVEFEPTIPVFERAKTVHALDRAATVIGCFACYLSIPIIPYSYGVEVFILFWIYTQAIVVLGRVIGSSQGLYLNIGQHKHRKTRAHTHTHTHAHSSMP